MKNDIIKFLLENKQAGYKVSKHRVSLNSAQEEVTSSFFKGLMKVLKEEGVSLGVIVSFKNMPKIEYYKFLVSFVEHLNLVGVPFDRQAVIEVTVPQSEQNKIEEAFVIGEAKITRYKNNTVLLTGLIPVTGIVIDSFWSIYFSKGIFYFDYKDIEQLLKENDTSDANWDSIFTNENIVPVMSDEDFDNLMATLTMNDDTWI